MGTKVAVPLVIGGVPVGRGLLSLFAVEEVSAKMKKFQSGTLVAVDVSVKLVEDSSPLNIGGVDRAGQPGTLPGEGQIDQPLDASFNLFDFSGTSFFGICIGGNDVFSFNGVGMESPEQ